MSKNNITSPTKSTHFLVSGGGKGITAANVIALAEAYQSKFTLLGRSKLLPEEPDWAQGLESDSELKQNLLTATQSKNQKISPKEMDQKVREVQSSREIQRTIHRIQNTGSQVQYIQVDITDPDDLNQKLDPIKDSINGLLHGAGSLADKYIEDKTEADFDLVYGVKINGLNNLLNIIQPEALDFIILFSSVAGFYGNAGQADYSLANDVLNKLAHHLKGKYPDCQVLAVDWGPWDGGMVSPQLKRILNKKKVHVISIEEGTSTLVDLLSRPIEIPQWVVGSPMPSPSLKMKDELRKYRIQRQLSLENNPFLTDHVIGGKAVLPTVCAVAWFVDSCEKIYPGYTFFEVREYQVFKGIVFDEVNQEEFILELEERDKSQTSIIFQGKISSQSPTGKTRYHYQAEVELRKSLPEIPKISAINKEAAIVKSGRDLYQENILFHGPSFQGVKEVINITPEGLVMKCNLESISSIEMGQFPAGQFNPFLADVHLQSILIWAWDQRHSTGLPLKIARGTQYQTPPAAEDTYATMEITSQSNHKIVANVISHDQHGNVYVEVEGAEITLNDNLFELYQENTLRVEKA